MRKAVTVKCPKKSQSPLVLIYSIYSDDRLVREAPSYNFSRFAFVILCMSTCGRSISSHVFHQIVVFSGKTVAYQELFYVVTLTASWVQPKRRQKRDNKQATGVVSKTKTLNARHTFWQIYLPSLHDVIKLDWNGDTNVALISKMVASSIPWSVAIVAVSISSEITITKTYLYCALHNLCIEHSHRVINIYYLYFVIIINTKVLLWNCRR